MHKNSVKKENYEKKDQLSSNKSVNILYEEKLNLNGLYNIDDKDFNIFKFVEKIGKENTLQLISKYIFNYLNLVKLSIYQNIIIGAKKD